MSDAKFIVGIDLGTTTSSVAAVSAGVPEVLTDPEGNGFGMSQYLG